MQVVIFKLDQEQFAVETSVVQSINDTIKATQVPTAPPYIKGLINLRGNVITLLDLNMILDIEKGEGVEENIIILQKDEELIGISVEQVDEVIDIDDELLEKSPDSSKEYIQGIINFQDKIVTLLNVDKIL